MMAWFKGFSSWLSPSAPWRETIIREWTRKEKERIHEKVMEHTDRDKNIILLGPYGTGKSSFAVAAASALKGNFLSISQTRPHEASVTKKLWPTPLETSKGKVKLCITDCQGLENGTELEMDALNLDVFKSVMENGAWTDEENTEITVDAVVLIFKYREDFGELVDRKFIMDVIKLPMSMNIPVFVMVTHIDAAFNPKENFQLKRVFHEEKFKNVVENVHDNLHIERRNILLQCNYNNTDQVLKWENDLLTLYNLWYIVSNIRL